MMIAYKSIFYEKGNGTRGAALIAYFFDFDNRRREPDGSIPWPYFHLEADVDVSNLVGEQEFMTIAVLDNRMYLCTGYRGHFFEFNLQTFTWKQLDFRHQSNRCALVYLDGWLYALGGYSLIFKIEGGYSQTARRYHLLNQTTEDFMDNLPDPDELRYFGNLSAVTHKGNIIMYGHDARYFPGADMPEKTHKLVVYNPSNNEWHVVYQERHNTHTLSTAGELHSAVVKCDNKLYRVIYHSEEITPDTDIFKDTPQVNELVLDLESKPPTCQIGAPQDQSSLCDDNSDIQYQGEFCINNELYHNINGCIIRTGYVMTGDDRDVATRKKWKLIYSDRVGEATFAFGPVNAHDMWNRYDEYKAEENLGN